MLVLDSTLKNAIQEKTLTLCWCWLITRIDGAQLGFTNLDQAFVIDGVTYNSFTGFDPSASQQSEGVNKIDSQSLKGILDQSGISKRDLEGGIYQDARVQRFIINYSNVPSTLSLNPPNHIELPSGYLSDFSQTTLGFDVKVKSFLSKLDNNIGTSTSKTCRAHLGDKVCRKDITNYIHVLNVVAVTNQRIFTVDASLPDKHLDKGRLQFTSGQNDTYHLDIAYYFNNQIVLFQSAPFSIAVGDTLTAIAGCAKTKLACIVKYNNFYFFDAEPDIPTTDLAIDTPTS